MRAELGLSDGRRFQATITYTPTAWGRKGRMALAAKVFDDLPRGRQPVTIFLDGWAVASPMGDFPETHPRDWITIEQFIELDLSNAPEVVDPIFPDPLPEPVRVGSSLQGAADAWFREIFG